VIGFARITAWSSFSSIYGEHWVAGRDHGRLGARRRRALGNAGRLAAAVLLRRLGFDPAVSSAPFVATLVDVTGLVIYFSVGIVILRGTIAFSG